MAMAAALCCVLGAPVMLRAREGDDGAKRDSGKSMEAVVWRLTQWNGGEVRMESTSLRGNSGEVAHADSLHKKMNVGIQVCAGTWGRG